ncbi:MAG: peptide-N-glycosidase F-related protein [Chitinophagales bacterium]|nr:T9SS type A sorting domain-containing protein [Bacteroidota bacterium]
MLSYITKIFTTITIFFITTTALLAGPGDTIKVQTFTFGSPQDAWFDLPGLDVNVEKVLMKYTLKCNPAQSPACGEWDYLTYTYLYEHTGNLDSTLLTHPYFTANGASPDELNYSTTPTYTTVPSWQYTVVYDDTISYNEYQTGTTTDFAFYPLYTAYPVGRTQILWSASELTAAGLTAGNISGMNFDIYTPGDEMKNFSIRLKSTLLTEFTTTVFESGFTEVYRQNTSFNTGWDGIDFTTPFYWDGVSNIIVEITYDNTNPTGLSYMTGMETTPYHSLLTGCTNDKYVEFYNPDYADVLGNPLAGLSDQVTVAFWSQGDPDFQPQNGTTFEAVTGSDARVLNSHTPWSDANVYWDAGNAGGYDRINQVAPAADYEGNWTYWTFTKNTTTGSMKVYKNGVLWHSGTGKTKLMEGIEKLRLGKGNWGGSESYAGNMDEFAIWNVELDAATIASYMYKDLDGAHPYAANLLLYYNFNDGNGLTEPDIVNDNDLALVGAVERFIKSEDIFRNISSTAVRPVVKFEQGEFVSHIDSVLIVEDVITDPIALIIYDPADPLTATDSILVYPAEFYTYTYNADGTIADSTLVTATNTISNYDLEYYGEPFEVVNTHELARYITPYGIGLDLGDGFTWTFDLSDYRPLLHDSVHLNAGNWQELLDMELLFIEGTPPRDPIAVTNLWYGFYGYGLTPSFDELTPPQTVTIPADAKNSRVKIRATGHGFGGTSNCSEFCAREHYLKLNGSTVWSKEVWRDNCDLNPVYPQGGTWVYDRANWCPGAEVTTYDFELTPDVVPGSTYTFDYTAEDYTWNGAGSVPTYVTSVQLITYGDPNFNLDARLDAIIAPSDDDMQQRKNPICNNPIVRITNTGATPLTSLDITFGIKDYDQDTYTWTGNLAFMESEEVTLPNFGWTNGGTAFIATVSNPNGGTDEYSYNNSITTPLAIPVTYPNEFIIETRTNTASHENDLFVYDENGNTILERTTFADNTTYKDTLNLPDGCYELYLWDYGEDGLSWWANSDGNGSFKTREIDGAYIKNFEPDFGGLIYFQFTVGNYTPVAAFVPPADVLNVYPNPASTDIFIDIDLAQLNNVDVTVLDITGKIVYTEHLSRVQDATLHLNLENYATGIYTVVANTNGKIMTKQFVVEK